MRENDKLPHVIDFSLLKYYTVIYAVIYAVRHCKTHHIQAAAVSSLASSVNLPEMNPHSFVSSYVCKRLINHVTRYVTQLRKTKPQSVLALDDLF